MSRRHIILIVSLLLQAGVVMAIDVPAQALTEAAVAKETARETEARAYLSGEAARLAALRAADDGLRGLVANALRPDAVETPTAAAKRLDIGAMKNSIAAYEDAVQRLPAAAGIEDAGKKLKAATDTAKQRISALDKEVTAFVRLAEKEVQKRLPRLLSTTMETRGALLNLRMAAETCRTQVENLVLASDRAANAARRQLQLIKPPAAKPALPQPSR